MKQGRIFPDKTKAAVPRHSPIQTVALYFDSFGAGGVQRCLRILAGVFQSMGKKVVYVSETPAPAEEKSSFPPGVEFFYLRKGWDYNLSSDERHHLWCDVIGRFSVDVVYYAAYQVPQLCADIQSIHTAGTPVVVHFHTAFSARVAVLGPAAFLERLKGWRLADAFVVLSRTDECFFREMGIPCRFVPNPPPWPEPRVSSPRSLSGKNRIVWCGQIRDIPKRPSDAVRILAAVRKRIPSATLTVIGDATSSPVTIAAKESMKRTATELGCEDAIEWAGYHTDVSPFLAKGDVFLSTSAYEGAPFTFMEAFAHGLPIVAYSLPYVETAQNPLAVRQVPQCDVDSAAGEVVRLFNDPGEYGESSAAALAVFRHFASFDQKDIWTGILSNLPDHPRVSEPPVAEPGSVSLVLKTLLEHTCIWEARMQRDRSALSARNSALERSVSLRLGLLLTAIPRKIFEFIRRESPDATPPVQ